MPRSINRRNTAAVLTALVAMTTSFGCEAITERELSADDDRIVGGEDVSSPTEYPFMAMMMKRNADGVFVSRGCGGTLIDEQWVLGAAHCVTTGEYGFAFGSLVPAADPDTAVVIPVSEVHLPPEYEPGPAKPFDVALFRLERPVPYQPIALATDDPEPGDDATVLGWGWTEDLTASKTLKEVTVPIVDDETCREAYEGEREVVPGDMICAGYEEGGRDSCLGDSGGPLLVPTKTGYQQVGVVSWGEGCALEDYYGVYSRVSHHRDWIESVTDELDGMSEGYIVSTHADLSTEDQMAAVTDTLYVMAWDSRIDGEHIVEGYVEVHGVSAEGSSMVVHAPLQAEDDGSYRSFVALAGFRMESMIQIWVTVVDVEGHEEHLLGGPFGGYQVWVLPPDEG